MDINKPSLLKAIDLIFRGCPQHCLLTSCIQLPPRDFYELQCYYQLLGPQHSQITHDGELKFNYRGTNWVASCPNPPVAKPRLILSYELDC